jgi:hypothetical protein
MISSILHHLSIFRISFTQQLTLKRIPRTSYQMHPSFTSGINNHYKLHIKFSMTRELKQVHSKLFK